MRACYRCQRHIFDEVVTCPFCEASHRVTSKSPAAVVLLGLTLASCTDRPGDEQGSGSGTMGSNSGVSATMDGSASQTGVVDNTTSTTAPGSTGSMTATDTGMSMTATSTGEGMSTGGSGGDTAGTTTGPGEDTVTVPPYAGALPAEDEAASPDPDMSTSGAVRR